MSIIKNSNITQPTLTQPTPRIIYYYQTLTDLSPILFENTPVTHIFLSAFHFGNNPDKSPYIHLNDHDPLNEKFDKVWKQLIVAKHTYNIEIHIMLGGSGGAYYDLFKDFNTYYPMLIKLILLKSIITGINLDIEEYVELNQVKNLIFCLKRDLGYNFSISMAPVQGSLQTDQSGMGGFCYKDLYNSSEGKDIDFFNGQFYFDLSACCYDQCITNGYKPNQVILGMIQDQDFETAKNVIQQIYKKYPDFGGVYMWQYFDAPPDKTKDPGQWAIQIKKIFDTIDTNETTNESNETTNESNETTNESNETTNESNETNNKSFINYFNPFFYFG